MVQLRWRELFEAVGLIAIVGSLVFVGVQLRQDHVIARSELTSGSFQIVISLQQSLTNPAFAKTFSKMLDQPDDLSLDEKVQIDNFFSSLNTMYIRECYLKGRGILAECDAVVRNTARKYFGNRYGQSWWRLYGFKGNESDELFPFPNWVGAEIENYDPNAYRQMLEDTGAGS